MKAGKLGQTTEDRQRESKVATTEKSKTWEKNSKISNSYAVLYIMCSSIQVLVLIVRQIDL